MYKVIFAFKSTGRWLLDLLERAQRALAKTRRTPRGAFALWVLALVPSLWGAYSAAKTRAAAESGERFLPRSRCGPLPPFADNPQPQ